MLLDIHPQPDHPRVMVIRAGRSTPIGSLDASEDNQEIRLARRRLVSVQRAGLFRTERRSIFTMRKYHDSVEAWLDDRAERGATSIIPPDVMRAARREMKGKGGTLVVANRIRATTLRKKALEV